MKRCFLQFLIFYFILVPGYQGSAQNVNGFNKIVLDAGHGGYDKGAIGKDSQEKDLTLALTLKTGKLIKDSMPAVDVIYTRTSDKFVELHKRAAIANENAADLFISIHCNSNLSPKPFGTETFVMGLHKSAENLEVAKTENAAILMEENYTNQYDGFDPNLDEDYITLNMFQSAHIEQSLELSRIVQNKMMKVAGMHDLGVKQAGFVVLYLTTMPGILIEIGFISNPAEEKFLLNTQNQDKIASAIFEAVKDYQATIEKPVLSIIEPTVVIDEKQEVTSETEYRIGFASFKKLQPVNFSGFSEMPDVRYFYINKRYLYTCGIANTFENAVELYITLSKAGRIGEKYRKNAEIIELKDNEVISRVNAIQYLKKNNRFVKK